MGEGSQHRQHGAVEKPSGIIHRKHFLTSLPPFPGSLSNSGGSSEVREEFEAEVHHKIPDVSRHLGPGNEDAPDEHHQDCIEGIADVPQPGTHN